MTIDPWMYAAAGAVIGFVVGRVSAPTEKRIVTTLTPSAPSREMSRIVEGSPREMIGTALAELESHIRQGNLIEAIKLYREVTGQGLKESKDAVEMLRRRLGG